MNKKQLIIFNLVVTAICVALVIGLFAFIS